MHPQTTFEETLPKKQGNASDDVMASVSPSALLYTIKLSNSCFDITHHPLIWLSCVKMSREHAAEAKTIPMFILFMLVRANVHNKWELFDVR